MLCIKRGVIMVSMNNNVNSSANHVVTFAHFKGGTGKTTSCLNIAGFLAKYGAKVLVIDLDPQANLTQSLGVDVETLGKSMYDVMAHKKNIKDIVISTKIPQLDLAPATPYLMHTTLKKYESKKDALILKTAIKNIKDDYQFTLIDLPPSNGHFIVNGVMASDSVIVVLDTSVYALNGLETFRTAFDSYCDKIGIDLNIAMALVTKCKKHFNPFKKNIGKEIGKSTKSILGTSVFLVPYSDHVYESQIKQIPISHHKPGSDIGAAYMRIAEEIVSLRN
jgi:chromosome partitioning protein